MRSRTINSDLLPILTDTVDGTKIDLPMLTEAVGAHLSATKRAFPLTNEQCQQLAEQLFPQLETTLRSAIGSRSEAKWEKAMQQVQAALPDLINDAVRPR